LIATHRQRAWLITTASLRFITSLRDRTFDPLFDEAKCLRLLLKAYPQGASQLNNAGQTPYSILQYIKNSTYACCLLLMVAPSLDPALLRQVNYEARRQLLFLVFAAVSPPSPPPAPPRPNLLRRIHKSQGGPDLTRKIATFL